MSLSHVTGINSDRGPEVNSLALAVNALVDAVNAGASLAPIPDQNLLGNVSGGSAAPVAVTLSSLLDEIFSTSRGQILYRGASSWSALAAGGSGQVLTAARPGADPHWAAAGAGLSAIADKNLLANTSGGTAVPIATTVSALLDEAIDNTQGDVLYRSATGWVALPIGSLGTVLTSQGAAQTRSGRRRAAHPLARLQHSGRPT